MTKLPFSAVVSDLDGTLLDINHQLNDDTADLLRKLEKKGVDIILASGRNYADMSSILKMAGIENATMITSNGAMTYNLQGNILDAHYLDEDIAFNLMNMPFDVTTTLLNTYQEKNWYINVDMPILNEYHKDSNFTYQVIDFAKHHGRCVEKVFFIAKTTEDLLPLEKEIADKFADKITMTYSSISCLDVMSKDVCKGSALANLLKNRNYDLSDCIAFGDGLNDKEMLEIVGKGCVMENADSRLIETVPHLEKIGSNTDLAVTHYLRQLFKLN